jgi:hypothetical protein
MYIMMHSLTDPNAVLATFNGQVRFGRRLGRLRLEYLGIDGRSVGRSVGVQVNKNSGALGINYGRFGMGGTQALAAGQLVLWIRDKPRVPLRAWEYWASPTVLLAGGNSDRMLALLRASAYDDGVKTRCVLCGGDRCGDWWNLDGLTGPCCTYGRCQRST